MVRYSVQPRAQIFVKSYGFLSFAKPMDKIIGKNVSKNLNFKYSNIILKNLEQMHLKCLQKG